MNSPPHSLSGDIKEDFAHTESVSVASGGRVDRNKVWRKIDIRIVPVIAFMYLLTFLVRIPSIVSYEESIKSFYLSRIEQISATHASQACRRTLV